MALMVAAEYSIGFGSGSVNVRPSEYQRALVMPAAEAMGILRWRNEMTKIMNPEDSRKDAKAQGPEVTETQMGGGRVRRVTRF